MITLRNVTVTYGNTLALESLDLELRNGISGIFGPNGAGKSTLLRLLAGLLKPSAGTIETEGRPVRFDEELRGRIGYAGHEPGLYGRLTVKENLELFARLHGSARSNVDRMLHDLDLEDRAGARVEELSAGQRRRVAVARAMVHDPAILLLDEPYANVDDDAADVLSRALVEWRAPGRIALIATHGAKRVKPFADASVILQRGRVVSHRVRLPEDAVEAVLEPEA